VPVWLKDTLQAFSQDDLRRFLMFVTVRQYAVSSMMASLLS
jgi:hypothetical protein